MTVNNEARIQQPIGSEFGRRTEPDEVLAGIDLNDKVAVVTGGYSGIGLETTRALAKAGARVYVPVRNPEKARGTLEDIPGDVRTGAMDLADIRSVRNYAQGVASQEQKIDLLINNAGIMACPETRFVNDWEAQFAVNHLGHFVLTNALLSQLKNAGEARVVQLSSVGHRRSDIIWDDPFFTSHPYEKWEAYGQSKTANALFALGLDMKFAEQGIRAFSVHPGGILTPLQRHLPKEEMQELGWLDEEGNLSELAASLFKSPSQGCTTTLWAATSPALGDKGGLYCEDCDVARIATADSPRHCDVAEWATRPESAERLWAMSESLLA